MYHKILDDQIKEKNQKNQRQNNVNKNNQKIQNYDNNNTIYQFYNHDNDNVNDNINDMNICQENDYNLDNNVNPVYKRPFSNQKNIGQNRPNLQVYKNNLCVNDYLNIIKKINYIRIELNEEERINKYLKNVLEHKIQLNNDLEIKLNIERKKNSELINNLKTELIKNKELENELN